MATQKFTNSLSDALTEYWTNYVGWGRATRSEYWWVVLFYSILASALLEAIDPSLSMIWSLVTLVPGFTLGARRLHDAGHSNWNICWALLPIIGWIILLVYVCQPSQPKANKWGAPRI